MTRIYIQPGPKPWRVRIDRHESGGVTVWFQRVGSDGFGFRFDAREGSILKNAGKLFMLAAADPDHPEFTFSLANYGCACLLKFALEFSLAGAL